MANIKRAKCPLRTTEIFEAGGNSGSGYPIYWTKHTEFEDCYLEECAAYNKVCGCTKFDIDAKNRKIELMGLLP